MTTAEIGEVSQRSIYIAAKELAYRWQCDASTVYRVAERAGFKKFSFGQGKHGLTRYLRTEVEAYECSRQAKCGANHA